MLVRLQQNMNWEIPYVQAGFRKVKGTRDQIANIWWIIEKANEFQKNIYVCFITMQKSLTMWIKTDCGKFLKRWEYQTTLCVFWETYTRAGQKATVGTLHETTDWLKIRKGIWHSCILSPCIFYLYAGYIMRNARLDESQVGIKIAKWYISNFRHADDTTLMVEIEEDRKSLLMKVKEESEKLA